MKKNIGQADRVIRLTLAAIIIVLYVLDVVGGVFGVILLIFSAVFVVTAFMKFCPLYLPFRFNTLFGKEKL